MATKRQGLHKGVAEIFGDGSLPQEFVVKQSEVDKPTLKEGAKAAPKRRRRKTADSKASAAVAVATPPKKKKRSPRRASPKKKLIQEQDAAADATEKISVDSAESLILDPPPGIADATPDKEPILVKSRREESPVEEGDTSQAVDESSVDVELPSDTTTETTEMADESPALTKPAKAEETGTCDQDENSAQVITEPPCGAETGGEPEESPPLGSIDFLENIKKSMECPKNFECCQDRFIDICKAKVSGNGKKVICLEGKRCGCRFQTKALFKRICTCDMRQHIAREYGF